MSGPTEREPLNLLDYERLAAARLEATARDYYSSGAGDEVTVARNREAFGELRLLPRVLVDVSGRSQAVEVLGCELSTPVAIAPTAFHKLAHPDGEVAMARGAGAAGTAMCFSTLSNTEPEQVATAATGPLWFQLYAFRDRGLTRELIERAEAAGYRAIVLTVDAPLLGRREQDVANEFSLPDGLGIPCAPAADLGPAERESGLARFFEELLDASLEWADLEWVVGLTSLPVAVKGVHRADDALRAIERGARGVIVSNHGGRQLDTVPASIEMLPAIAEALDGAAEVLLDGGVRRGTDAVKALALGADAVLIGRPALWGLAVGGEEGVRSVLALLCREIDEALALCGVPSVADLDRGLVSPGAGFAPTSGPSSA